MISKVSIRNYKCLRDVQIDLERFTVFVGPNASGKSSILQALDVLCRAFRGPEGSVDPELGQAKSRGATESVGLAAESGGQWYYYQPRVQPTQSNPDVLARNPPCWKGEGRAVASALGAEDWKTWRVNGNGTVPLPMSVLLRLETSKLILATPAISDPSAMMPDGAGLHSALANMALNDPDSWQRLQADLRKIVPTIRRLRHSKSGSLHQPPALLFDTISADSIPAIQISEGTLLVLGLLAALHSPGRPNLILLDDLDRGLHPTAQRELVALLRGLLATTSDLQVVATTHSPYLLYWVKPNEVRMTFLREDGSTACGALTSHPKFEKWKNEMTSGEMWSLFGENWLVAEGVTV